MQRIVRDDVIVDRGDGRTARLGLPTRVDPRTATPVVPERPVTPKRKGWLEERLGVSGFYSKYGRKAFPVHTTFFLGEMATFSFFILVVTGIYLGLIYIPSNVEIDVEGERLPQAYASVRLIESIPVANLFRNVHHWAAHLMVASTLLHSLRIFFFGNYRKPRELNWLFGVGLLSLTLLASFLGYALPYDAYAVTATGIGYSIARSIPWAGNVVAELFFGGAFPTLGSLPRLYTLHVFVVPAMTAALIGIHLLLIIKNKHTQPGYARKLAEPGRVLGVPFWPYQTLLAVQLLMLMFGGLFILSALVPIHPLEAYGPPGPETPDVKPDWYLLWVYGFLKMIPSGAVLSTPIGTIGPEFLGGLLFPGLIFGLMALAPWLDSTNRPSVKRYEYLEPPRQAPVRLAIGVFMLAYVGMLFFAAYYDEVGLTLAQMWYLSIVIPGALATAALLWAKWAGPDAEQRFDPTAEEMPDEEVPAAH